MNYQADNEMQLKCDRNIPRLSEKLLFCLHNSNEEYHETFIILAAKQNISDGTDMSDLSVGIVGMLNRGRKGQKAVEVIRPRRKGKGEYTAYSVKIRRKF